MLESDGIIDMETKGDASQAMPKQDGEDPKEHSTSETIKEKIEEEGNIVEQPSHVCPNFMSDLLVDHTSRQQRCDTSGAQVIPAFVFLCETRSKSVEPASPDVKRCECQPSNF
jgi:hypothetical protein